MIIKSEKGERVSEGVDVFVCVLAPDCVCVGESERESKRKNPMNQNQERFVIPL